ncbi:hypothetical protein LINPERHAP1_LOCUS32523 [Linum perenne]
MQNLPGSLAVEKRAAICWNIWKTRNEAVFRNNAPDPRRTWENTSLDILLWSNTTPGPLTPQRRPDTSLLPLNAPHPNNNPPPHTPSLRVYCDGSFLEGPQKAAYGVVILNTLGHVCDGRAGRVLCSSPMAAEARALLEAVSMVNRTPVPCTIYSDCLNLVNCLIGQIKSGPWECFGLLARISTILTDSPNIQVCFTPRKHNKIADWVARSARDSILPPNWLLNIPNFPVEPG